MAAGRRARQFGIRKRDWGVTNGKRSEETAVELEVAEKAEEPRSGVSSQVLLEKCTIFAESTGTISFL